MTRPDIVPGIRPPYSDQFLLWYKDGRTVRPEDAVPDVGMTRDYAVRLAAPAGAPARYLWVQNGIVTNAMAHQPMQAAVFDPWGRYLGEGAEADDPPEPPPGQVPTLLQEVGVEERPTAGEQLGELLRERMPAAMLTHRFHLRRDLEIEVTLPADLTQDDVERLHRWLATLPLG